MRDSHYSHNFDGRSDVPDPSLASFTNLESLFANSPFKLEAFSAIGTLKAAFKAGLIPKVGQLFIASVLNTLDQNFQRIDFLKAINHIFQLEDAERAKVWHVLDRCRVNSKNFTKEVQQKLYIATLKLSNAQYPEVIAAAFKCLGKIKKQEQVAKFVNLVSIVKQMPVGEDRQSKILAALLPALVVKIGLRKSVTIEFVQDCLENLSYKRPTLSGMQAKVSVLSSQKTNDEILCDLYAIRELEELSDYKPEINELLTSTYFMYYGFYISKLPEHYKKVNASELFLALDAQQKSSNVNSTESLNLLAVLNFDTEPAAILEAAYDLWQSGISPFQAYTIGLQFKQLQLIKDNLSLSTDVHGNFLALIKAVLKCSERIANTGTCDQSTAIKCLIDRLANEDFVFLSNGFWREKLILCLDARGVEPEHCVSSFNEVKSLLTEIAAQNYIDKILFSGGEIQGLLEDYTEIFSGDNPPFSIYNTSIDKQAEFQAEIFDLWIKAEHPHTGFWLDTYNFRHTPLSRQCLFDTLAVNDLAADLYVIPAADIARFPGRGRYVKNINTDRLFGTGLNRANWKDAFANYSSADNLYDNIDFDILSILTDLEVAHLRAFEAYLLPNNSNLNIEGVNMALVIWNQHFDHCGVQPISLVPSVVLQHYFNKSLLVNYDPRMDDFPNMTTVLDVCENPPSLKAMKALAVQMRLPVGVIEPTAGTCFTGGFCNGFARGTSPYRLWERGINNWLDGFGLAHKYHIRTDSMLLAKLWQAHKKVYQITSTLMNARDIYKLTLAQAARDAFQLSSNYTGQRVLEYFCKFMDEYREIDQSHQAPVLVLAESQLPAPEINSPVVFDGQTGYCFSVWTEPFEIDMINGRPSAKTIDWWIEHVVPWLQDNEWWTPKLVARENAADLIDKLKGGK